MVRLSSAQKVIMKISAIDIGSNSVRLAVFEGGKTLYKRLCTTRLGEGLNKNPTLSPEALERTALAVDGFYRQATEDGAEKVYAFATAAVRTATNGSDFLKRVKELCGLDICVLSGEEEAECGILGALGNSDGGIIDIGGASTEITLRKNGKTVYAKSVNIGAVRLFDSAKRDRAALQSIIDEKVAEYGKVDASSFKMYAIGGTATRLSAVKHNLKEYAPQITHGTQLTLAEVDELANRLLTDDVEHIKATTICAQSSEIMGGGTLLLSAIMRALNIDGVTVSESDNLEGFILFKEGKL